MTDEERDLITRFIERVSGANRSISGPASVPNTVQALPPIDPEADRLIGELFAKYPEARYRLTQTAFVQEHALGEAGARMAQLQQQVEQAQKAPAPVQGGQVAAPQSGGFFHNLFGGGQPQGQASPSAPMNPAWGQTQNAAPQYAQPQPQYSQPQYAQPQYAQQQYAPQGGMFQRSGSGFLGSALTTAAGVAGGMVAGNALMSLFEGPRQFGGGFGGGGFGGGGFGGGGFGGGGFGGPGPGYDQGYGGGPWGGEPAAPDAQVSGSGWDNQAESAPAGQWDATGDPGQADSSGDQGGGDFGGGDGGGGDFGGGDGGGWDQGGGF